MASNRLRSLRNVGTRLNYAQTSVSGLRRRPSPKKLAQNLINTGNMRRYTATEPIIAPNAITNEKIDNGAVDTPELADNAVTEEKLDIDAVTNKNITSCTITDSDVNNCRFDSFEGTNLTVTSTFNLTSGTIAQVDITGPSTLTGADVELNACTLTSCTANELLGTGGLNLVGNGDIGIAGSGVSIDGGGSVITVAGGNIGIGAGGSGAQFDGSNVNLSGGALAISCGWGAVTAGGQNFWQNGNFTDLKQRVTTLEGQITTLQSQIAGKADAGHSHPGL